MATPRATIAASRSARQVRERLRQDLESLCRDGGVSQRALAKAASVPQSYVSEIFAGAALPSLETYACLAAALGADLSAHVYPHTGPAIRDRLSVPILESMLGDLHPRWQPFTEVRVVRPGRGWIDLVLHERRESLFVASEIQSRLERIEQLIRWSSEKAGSLPSWSGWPAMPADARVSQLLVVRWTRSTREATRAAVRQLGLAYPAHPDDALAALFGTAPWPGSALIWARVDGRGVRFVPGR
ncbi:MAG TPA: helix-turn-helix transcriptional regulator [Candidatus Limnocylindrales bacterium]